jgi:hypothetical protein
MVRRQGALIMRIANHLNSRERTALVFCVAFMVATLMLSTLDQRSVLHSARSMIDPNYLDVQYTGTIVVPAQMSGQCRYTQFNNRTIELKGSEIGECYNKSGAISPNDRMNSLRDAFKR